MRILKLLLDKLRESQSFCPYCAGEYACDDECPLKGLWFDEETR